LCRASADFFKTAGAWIERGRTPEPGDVIFFYRSGEINHMGIVSRAAGGSVITIEGNSGDSVAERCYSVGDGGIAGYGRPRWELAAEDTAPGAEPVEPAVTEKRFYTLRMPYLSRGSFGELVAAVQTLLILEGYPCGPDGADGDFGPNTEAAVREFQDQLGLAPDGIVGPETGAALFGVETVKETNTYGLGAQLAQKIREGE
jgi:hypothetical protein